MQQLKYQLKDALNFTLENVQEKLAKTLVAVETDLSYVKELEILQEAVLASIPLSQIIIKIGAAWIPLEYYEQFCVEVLEVEVKLFYTHLTHTWEIRKGETLGMGNQDWGWEYDVYQEGGGIFYSHVSAFPAVGKKMSDGLFTLALNQSVPEVRVKPDDFTPTETHAYLTRQAIAKQNQIKRRFDAWCREDESRAEALEAIYNAKINQTVLTDWTGKGLHLKDTLIAIGLNPDWASKLRNYQLDAIWRFSLTGGIIALEVGLGKTAVACAAIMLRRHYQTCQKALVVVQRSTLNQFYYTFQEMFPRAKVLCAAPERLGVDYRQGCLAKIAYHNWDAVIMTHDSFGAIPFAVQTEISSLKEELTAITAEISRLYLMGESPRTSGKVLGNTVLKKLEGIKQNIKQDLNELSFDKSIGLTWEDLGVDFLLIDEVQRYKNNYVRTTLAGKIAGLTLKPSERAKDFALKIYWLRKRCGHQALVGMTGTPEPTNSLLGVYVFQMYFQPQELIRRGIYCLDAWISNFGEIRSQPEPKLDGRWRITERLTDFVNVAELAQLWFSIVHYKRYDQVKNDFEDTDKRPIPKYKTIISTMSEYQKQEIEAIAIRYQQLRKGTPHLFPLLDKDGYLLTSKGNHVLHPVTRKAIKSLSQALELELKVEFTVDNFLLLSSHSRKLVLAEQLIKPDLPVQSESKLGQLGANILKIYQKTKSEKLTQVVFLDIGTPGGSAKFGLYNWLKEYLQSKGVPSQEIEFIQSHKKTEQKESLFQKINQGEVRILFSSSETGGIGVNIQERLCALHHGDFALRPDILEQREGRAIRQGNCNKVVEIYRYITEGSNGRHGADTVLLQLLQNKQKTRDRFFSGDPTLRRLSEGDNQAELYMILKAESTGDERVIRYTEVEVELDERAAELALAQSELVRIDGKKAGSIKNSAKIIAAYKSNTNKYLKEIDRVYPYVHLGIENQELIHCCFDDKRLVVGYTEVVRNQPYLKKPDWLTKLRSLYAQDYGELRLEVLPLRQAQKYIANRIKQEILSLDYDLEPGSFRSSKNDVYELGFYCGLTILVAVFGNDCFGLCLEGHEQWKISFRRTESLLLEQLESGVVQVLNSRQRNEKALQVQERRLRQLHQRRKEITQTTSFLQAEVTKLEQERSKLQEVLEIEI